MFQVVCMCVTAVSTIEVAEGFRKAAGVLLQHHKHVSGSTSYIYT